MPALIPTCLVASVLAASPMATIVQPCAQTGLQILAPQLSLIDKLNHFTLTRRLRKASHTHRPDSPEIAAMKLEDKG